MAIRITAQPITPSAAELDALRAAIAESQPALAPALAPAQAADRSVQVALLNQPFFAGHRIYEAQLHGRIPTRRVHFAVAPSGAVRVLTGQLAHLQAIAHAEPPALPDVDTARAFANFGDFWTTESELGELLLKSLDDVPWLSELHPGEHALIDNLRHKLGDHVRPPTVTQEGDTVIIIKWLLIRCALVRRELRVTMAGQLTRADEVLDTDLPVPPGNVWGQVNGQLVPIG